MPRELTDPEGTRWTCAEAYAGLGGAAAPGAARVDGGRFRVVCTPSGGERSVELELAGGWQDSMTDDELLAAIRRAAAARG